MQCRDFGPDHAGACRFAMFNRHGGVSAEPFSSFNTSYTVGDSSSAVTENRARIKEILGISTLFSARQIHGDEIYCLDSKPQGDLEVDGYDALITDLTDVGIMIQHADCQAVLLFDPQKRVVGAVHCGWRGSVLDILGKTVRAFTTFYKSRPENLLATISPSLGPCCSEFVNHQLELPAHFQRFHTGENHFDFWKISGEQLVAAGLKTSSITVAGECTSCSSDYFSYRRAKRRGNDVTGRNGTIVALGRPGKNT